MTPFAGVGVNVAMEDALHLARQIISARNSWLTKSALAAALQVYEKDMFVRAEEYAKQTWMYLGLFFHERGGVAMVEHFERTRAMEAATAGGSAEGEAAGEEKEEVEKKTVEKGLDVEELGLHRSGLGIAPPMVAEVVAAGQ